jgi:aldehyde:ferredoxin oxidoreductase
MIRNGKAEQRIIRGASNRILEADLSSGTVEIFTVPDRDRLLFLGGKGLGLKLLYDRMEPGADPLGPGNMMAIMPGIMMGTGAPCSGKFAAAAKSPLTGIFTTSSCGGPFGMALKTSGWDGLLIKGRASSPVLLAVDSAGLRFLPAEHLWGLDTARTQEELRPLGTGALVIGPAGENLVPYACAVSGHRVLGRGGLGAVLGSKNVKAIIARGDEFEIAPADRKALAAARKKGIAYINRNRLSGEFYRKYGTNTNVGLNRGHGLLPVRNFRGMDLPGVEAISGERIAERHTSGFLACKSCAILCGHKGKFSGAEKPVPEYETVGLFGANIGILDPEPIAGWSQTCTHLGLDTMSTAGTLAWAMEATEKGLFASPLRFGDPENIEPILHDIAARRGLGADLALGSRSLAEKYGGAEFAVQVKGLEMAAYDPRGAWGQGLSYAVANRGACHLSSTLFSVETFLGLAYARTWRGKPALVVFFENLFAAVNSMHLCVFTGFPFGLEPALIRVTPRWLMRPALAVMARFAVRLMDISLWPELYRSVIRRRLGMAAFLRAGARVHVLERHMNVREGISRKDDTLPARFLNEGRADDPKRSTVPLDKMLDRYYKIRGFDREGKPTARLLARFKIERRAAPEGPR